MARPCAAPRSFEQATGQPALHLVSAWAASNRLVLSQRKVNKAQAHENEIVALPDLLRGIENRVHWVLDVVFGEDQSRTRREHGPENLALLRKMVMNLLRQESSQKLSLKVKRQLAGWDSDYLETVLTGKPYEPDERS